MIQVIQEVLAPDFILRNSVVVSLVLGIACPMAGVYLFLRRMVFLGAVLPQVSSCGVAFAFALPGWGLIRHAHDSAEERLLALAGSILFTLATVLTLAWLARKGRARGDARLGSIYVLAGALSILLLVKNPFGEHGLLGLLKGEIVAVSDTDLAVAFAIALCIATVLAIFQKTFLLISFDRDMAIVMRMNAFFWDLVLLGTIGLMVSVAVMIVGALVTFGLLLLPPLAAYPWVTRASQLPWFAALVGGIAAFTGFCVAYRYDFPAGPTIVLVAGVLAVASGLLRPRTKS